MAKGYGQGEGNEARLEIAYIYYQIFAAEYFMTVECFGRVDLLYLTHIVFFVSYQDTPPGTVALSDSNSHVPCSNRRHISSFLMALITFTHFLTYMLLFSPFLPYTA